MVVKFSLVCLLDFVVNVKCYVGLFEILVIEIFNQLRSGFNQCSFILILESNLEGIFVNYVKVFLDMFLL